MRGFSKVHIFVSPHSPVLKYSWDNTRRFAGQYSEQNGAGGDPTVTPSYTIENLLSISIIRDLPCRNLSLVRKVPQTMQTSGVIFCTAYHSSASSNTISSTDLPVRRSGQNQAPRKIRAFLFQSVQSAVPFETKALKNPLARPSKGKCPKVLDQLSAL